MGKFLSIILSLLASASLFAQSSYEWWIDNDLASRKTGTFDKSLEISPDISGIASGLHFFNFRLCNADNAWGSIYRKAFFKTEVPGDAVACQYWLDKDSLSITSGEVKPDANSYTIPLDNLKEGLHRFSYRLRNSKGVWGGIFTGWFYCLSPQARVAGYEYWLDNDFENRVKGTATAGELAIEVDLSALKKEGLHCFSLIRCSDDGRRSPVYRRFFYYADKQKTGRILGFRHAVNGTDLGYVSLAPQESDVYEFEVALPDGAGIDIAAIPVRFDGDVLSVAASDSISYSLQMESDRGLLAPAGYAFAAEVDYSTTAETVNVPSSTSLALSAGTLFKAVKFESKGKPLYIHTDDAASINIYRDGKVISSISAEKSTETNVVRLDAGTYYGVVRRSAKGADEGSVTFSIDDSNLQAVTIEYNGRYASLFSNDEGATIRYTLDGASPDNGTQYAGPFDVGGVCTINAVAKIGTDYTSGISTYKVNVYADEKHVQTAEAGHLPEAFGWNEGFANEVEEYRIAGPVNGRDLEKVRSMTALKHLDVKSAVCDSIPDGAFAGMNLISVSLPEKMRAYGNGIFSGCDMICAVICNDAGLTVDERITAGCGNPNVLVYVAEDQYTTDEADAALNIVAGATASRLRLLDAMPFYVPKAFKAVDASFARFFSKQTGMDGCAGWETITVPFDVDAIADSQGEVHPFAADTGDRRFWLYSPVKSGWERAAGIKANQPYLIAMPNHPWYDYDLNITGEVTFSAENVSVAASAPLTGMVFRKLYEMTGTFMPMAAAENVYAINDEGLEGYAPGAVFVSALRDIRPFECYISGETSARMMPVMDRSEVDVIPTDGDICITVENGDLCIRSGIDCRIPVYDTVGKLVRIAEVKAGETCRVSGLYKGIYIVGNRKLYVK